MAFSHLLDIVRILILVRNLEMFLIGKYTLLHVGEVAARPDDKEHKEQREPRIEVIGNRLQEQR